MSKVLSVPFFQDTAFVNDVTITSSLRSVVQSLIGHFTIFQSHGLSRWFSQKLWKVVKLRPKYCRYPFFRTRCIMSYKICRSHHRKCSDSSTPVSKIRLTCPQWRWNVSGMTGERWSHGKQRLKRWVLRRLRKMASYGADVTCCGRPFHTRGAATGKARSPTVDSRVR